MKSQSYEWIVFDAVGTLIYPDPPVHEVYASIGQQCGSRIPAEEIQGRFHRAYQHQHALPAEISSLRQTGDDCTEQGEYELWRRIVAEVFDDTIVPEAEFQELFAHFGKPSAWGVFEDVPQTFAELTSSGFRLAVASNFDSRLDLICDEIPILGQLAVRIISSQIGHRKPSLAFYDAVIDRTGSPADRLLMVGDDFENDVQAARDAGLAAVHLSRKKPPHKNGLRDLRDLSEWLRSPGLRSGAHSGTLLR